MVLLLIVLLSLLAGVRLFIYLNKPTQVSAATLLDLKIQAHARYLKNLQQVSDNQSADIAHLRQQVEKLSSKKSKK